MKNNIKKKIKTQQIKAGLVTKKQRSLLWEYILKEDMGVGYLHAQELQKIGFKVLKPLPLREGQPD